MKFACQKIFLKKKGLFRNCENTEFISISKIFNSSVLNVFLDINRQKGAAMTTNNNQSKMNGEF